MSVGASGSDYDVLAVPVSSADSGIEDAEGDDVEKTKIPRIFFGGKFVCSYRMMSAVYIIVFVTSISVV